MAEKPHTSDQSAAPQNSEPQPPSQSQKKLVKTILIVVGVLMVLGLIGLGIIGYVGKSLFDEATEGVTVSDEGVSIEREDEDFSFSTNTELADDFPASIPIYPESELANTSRTQRAEERMWMATFTSDASAEDVYEFYEDQLSGNGWETQSTFQSGDMSSIGAEKADENLNLNIGISDIDDQVSISVTVLQETEEEQE